MKSARFEEVARNTLFEGCVENGEIAACHYVSWQLFQVFTSESNHQ